MRTTKEVFFEFINANKDLKNYKLAFTKAEQLVEVSTIHNTDKVNHELLDEYINALENKQRALDNIREGEARLQNSKELFEEKFRYANDLPIMIDTGDRHNYALFKANIKRSGDSFDITYTAEPS